MEVIKHLVKVVDTFAVWCAGVGSAPYLKHLIDGSVVPAGADISLLKNVGMAAALELLCLALLYTYIDQVKEGE